MSSPIPRGVAVYDRPAPHFKAVRLLPLLLVVASGVAAGLHYLHYF